MYILVRVTTIDFTVSGIQQTPGGENGARRDIFMAGNRHRRLPGTMVILKNVCIFAINRYIKRQCKKGILQEYESSSLALFSF